MFKDLPTKSQRKNIKLQLKVSKKIQKNTLLELYYLSLGEFLRRMIMLV